MTETLDPVDQPTIDPPQQLEQQMLARAGADVSATAPPGGAAIFDARLCLASRRWQRVGGERRVWRTAAASMPGTAASTVSISASGLRFGVQQSARLLPYPVQQ